MNNNSDEDKSVNPIEKADIKNKDNKVNLRINFKEYKATSYNSRVNRNYYNQYNRYNRYNKVHVSNKGYYRPHVVISKEAYRLYIVLYSEYLKGDLSYADFIVLLEKEGFDTTILNFNADGTITIDYDSIDDVPDTITVKYKNSDIESSSDNIDTSNPDNYDAPVIDAGEVEAHAPSTSQSSSQVSAQFNSNSNGQVDSQSNSNSNSEVEA